MRNKKAVSQGQEVLGIPCSPAHAEAEPGGRASPPVSRLQGHFRNMAGAGHTAGPRTSQPIHLGEGGQDLAGSPLSPPPLPQAPAPPPCQPALRCNNCVLLLLGLQGTHR